MNKKILLIALTVMISISLIAASTMAWFTGSDDAGEAQFTAGTVKVTGGDAVEINGKSLGIVNPGDCYVISWTFKNDGTKKIQLRTELDYKWLNSLDKDNIFIIPAPVNEEFGYEYDWVLHQEAEGEPVYAYLKGYPNGLQPNDEVELRLIVYFDGEMTDNDYQGEEFTLGGKVEAVQTTNGAPSAVWGIAWDEINDENYSFDYNFWYEYWHDFDPMNVKCYAAYFNDDPEDPEDTKPGEFKIVLNSTKPKDGIATVDFHIHDLKDEMGKKINSFRDVNYKILVNGSIVYESTVNLEFKSGNANNHIVNNIAGNKKDNWKVIAEIDGTTIESKEKKL